MVRGFVLLLFLIGSFGFSPSASAETRALLIGVSDYDDAIGLADLKGPANDVKLLSQVLTDRGISNITILADGVEDAERPTRQAILDAFAEQAENAQDGDFIYIHLSGHGTRQADLNGDETDGLDEVFLPADTARSVIGSGTITNSLVDDEIGAAVRAIRAKGADVWLVMDSCHSGSGLRAATSDTANRFVDPALLGVSVAPVKRIEAEITETQGEDLPGDFIAFYAARSTEVAREVNLSTTPDTEAWYGLFSSKIAARLAGSEAMSFRQLFQSVMSDMNDATVPGGARAQTPLWEGTLIDAAVFGGGDTIGVRRFAVTADEMAAGLLHGIGEGTLVALVADAADAEDAIIGFAQTEAPTATLSYLRPVDAACIPQAEALCDYAGTLLENARFAQVVARPVDRQVRIGWPYDLASGQPLERGSEIVTALREAAGVVSAGDGFGVLLSDTDYTVESTWDGTALWLGARATQGATPVGLSWTPGLDDLPALLARIAKAEELARMLGSVADGGSVLSPNPVEVLAEYKASNISDLASIGALLTPARECRAAISRVQGNASSALETSADLKQCDQVTFGVKGRTAGSRDVNRIHIDAQYCVHAAYERIEDATAARKLGTEMTMCSDCPDGYAAGEERLFVIVTEGTANAEALNLEGLVENCGSAQGGTRGAAASNAMSFLTRIGQRPDTRGAFGGLGISGVWVEEYNWRVLPREEAFLKAGRGLE